MIFGDLPLAEAEGALLAHSRIVGGMRWAKARVLDADDLAMARAEGLETLTVARLEPDDVAEADAAARLGAALAGGGVAARAPVNGRVNLFAEAEGVLVYDPHAVDAVNAVDEGLTLGTLPPFARVAAGDAVATIKVIPYAIGGLALADAIAAATPLAVAAFTRTPVTLIQTRLPHQPDKLLAKTIEVTRTRIAALGSELHDGGDCPHESAALAELLRAANTPLILVAAASATVDRGDIIPSAIVAAGGEVIRVGMPVEPGNMLCLGRIGGAHVIGLPGCARSPKRNGLDLVLERLAAGLTVDSAAIAAMGVGGLLGEDDA